MMEDGKNGTERYIFVRYASSYINSEISNFSIPILRLTLDAVVFKRVNLAMIADSFQLLERGGEEEKKCQGMKVSGELSADNYYRVETSAFSKFVPFDRVSRSKRIHVS